jgi:hypothetical protein
MRQLHSSGSFGLSSKSPPDSGLSVFVWLKYIGQSIKMRKSPLEFLATLIVARPLQLATKPPSETLIRVKSS